MLPSSRPESFVPIPQVCAQFRYYDRIVCRRELYPIKESRLVATAELQGLIGKDNRNLLHIDPIIDDEEKQ